MNFIHNGGRTTIFAALDGSPVSMNRQLVESRERQKGNCSVSSQKINKDIVISFDY